MSDDDSNWLDGNNHEEETPRQKAREEPRGRGARGREGAAEEKREERESSRAEERKEEPKSNVEMSYWLGDLGKADEPEELEGKAARGRAFDAEMSYLLSSEELQSDKQINTSWMNSEPAQPARGNRNNRGASRKSEKAKEEPREEEEQPAPRRGNREPANSHRTQFEENQNWRQGYNRSHNGERDEGYRGRGRGRGGGRGGYAQREGQEEGGSRYGRSDQEGSFKKRDNQQYRGKAFETDSQQAPKRGNRNDNYQNNHYQNNHYQNRQYNNNGPRRENNNNYRNYDSRDGDSNSNRNFNNYNYNRNYNRSYNDNRDYGDNREYNQQSTAFSKKSYTQKNQANSTPTYTATPTHTATPPPTTPPPAKLEEKEDLIPKGRRCWPESSIYILGCRFSVTFRPVNEFRCKLMVIPYASLKMEYYPGNIINSSEVDYKARILAKGDLVSSAGSVYLQKAISVGSFTGLAFLKIDEKRAEDSLKLGIKKLLGQVEKVEGADLDTLVFPICDQLGSVDTIIASFLENLEVCKRVKEVHIATNQPDCFMDAMKIFLEMVQEMLDENKILIT